MKTIKTLFGVAAAAALLAVAATNPSRAFTRNEQMWSSYDPTEINGAHGGRQLPTLVTGNPFGGAQEAFAEAVVGAIRGSRGGRPTDPAVAATAPLRVLMMFNAATLTGDRICDRSKPLAVAPDTGPRAPVGSARVELVATYCRGDRPQTQVTASLDNVSGPSDPRFQDFIKQCILSLFPSRNPDMQGEGQFPD